MASCKPCIVFGDLCYLSARFAAFALERTTESPRGELAVPVLMEAPNGLEMSRPASQSYYRAKRKHSAGRVGSIDRLCKKSVESLDD